MIASRKDGGCAGEISEIVAAFQVIAKLRMITGKFSQRVDNHKFSCPENRGGFMVSFVVVRRYAIVLAIFIIFVAISCAGHLGTAVNSAVATHSRTTHANLRKRLEARPARLYLIKSARQDLTAAVAPLAREDGGHVAVAVADLATGAQAAYGGTEEFVTASIVKVDILATLLYQLQHPGQALSAEEQELAATMIENSDNDSASDLYDEVNGAEGIDDANRVFGLRQTTAGTGGYWGLTTTTADDQIRLLRLVFTRPSVLSSPSQHYSQGLMSQVEADQQWGVPAAADPGTRFMVKNGWLPNPTLWEINSIGEIVHEHQRLLIAVLSDDNASENSGIAVVEAVARAAAASVQGLKG
jgi:Beta-lactamase enzyme family